MKDIFILECYASHIPESVMEFGTPLCIITPVQELRTMYCQCNDELTVTR